MSDHQLGSCGHQVPPGARFCPECGRPAEPAAAAAPAATWPTQPPTPPTQPPTPPGAPPGPGVGWTPQPSGPEWVQSGAPPAGASASGRIVLVVVLVLVIVGGGAVAAYTLLGGGGGAYVSYNGLRVPLDDAVSSEPEEAWSWSSDDEISGVVENADGVLVSTGSGELVRLDDSGEEVWSVDTGVEGMSLAGLPDHEDVVIGIDYEQEELVVFSTEDGEELWSTSSSWLYSPAEDGLLVSGEGGSVGVLDLEGEEVWRTEGLISVAVVGDIVYLLTEDGLSRRSTTSDEEEWSIDVDVEESDEYSISVDATEEMVVVSGAEVTAYGTDGDELWREDGGPDGTQVSAFSPSEVVLIPLDWSDEAPEQSLTVFDEDGEVVELDSRGEEDYHFLLPVHSGGDFVIDDGPGVVYDSEYEIVAQHDGELFPADGGLYVVEPQVSGYSEEDYEESYAGTADISFVEYDGDDPRWTIEVDYDGYLNAATRDGMLILYDETELMAYK